VTEPFVMARVFDGRCEEAIAFNRPALGGAMTAS